MFQYQQQGQVYLTCNVRRTHRTDEDDAEDEAIRSPSALRSTLDDIEWLRQRLNNNLARQEDSEKRKPRIPRDHSWTDPVDGKSTVFSDESQFIRINYSDDGDDASSKRVELTGASVSEEAIDTECVPFEGQRLHHWREYPTVFTLGDEKGVV